MKRMLRYAADNGFDRVAWTTGRQQAERYDLRKVIQEVSYYPKNKQLIAKDLQGNDAIKQIVEPNKLDDYIGKEAAEKLLNSPLKKEYSGAEYHNIAGEQLAVGGEGMIAFYDKMLPNMMNKLGKQYGARVGEAEVVTRPGFKKYMVYDNKEKYLGEFEDLFLAERVIDRIGGGKIRTITSTPATEKVLSIDVTPALKKEAQERGFPMFSVAGGLAGFSQDDQGNIKFDPKYALLGMIGGTLAGKALGADAAKRLIDKMYKLKGEGIKFLEKQFDFRMGKLAEMDVKKAKALDDIVDGMLERQGTHPPAPSLGKRGGVKAAAEMMGADMRKKLEELIASRGTGAFRNAMKQGKVLGKSLEDLTQDQAIKIEKILSQMPERISQATRAAEGVIEQGAAIEGERGTVKAFFKQKMEKARKFIDMSVDTPFDEANLKRFGETAWQKGIHANVAREIDERITKDVTENIRKTFKGLLKRSDVKEAAADFKAAVTLNMEREMFGTEWGNVYAEAIQKVQDPVTKKFLERVKTIVDENSPMLKEYTKLFQDDFKQYREYLADEGLKKEFIEYYVTHIWNLEGQTQASARLALKTQFQYAKERLVPSYIEGIKYGLKPLGLDIVALNEHYKKALDTVIKNREFVQRLKSTVIEMPNMDKFKMVIDSKAFEALPGIDQRMYTTVNHRAFSGVYVHNEVAGYLRNIFENSKWREVWYGKKYLKVNQYMKRMKLSASGFHFVALGFNNLFYHGDKFYKIGNPLPFNLFGWESGMKKGLTAYREKNPIVEHLVKHGMTLDEGTMADYYQRFHRNILSWPTQKTGLKNIAQAGKDFAQVWDKALWDEYFVGSKAYAGMVAYGRNLKFLEKKFPKLYEEWRATGFAKTFTTAYEKEALRQAARDVNTLYGGLPYELYKISQTTQDTLRAFVLAPDWQVSNWMTFLNGVRNLATGGQSKTTVDAGRRLAQVVITLGGLGNMINYAATGRFVWDNPEGYKGMVAIGQVHGKPYYTDFYRHFGEFLKVFKYGNNKKISTYVYDSPLRYLVNKSSQLVRVMDAIRTGQDWRGRPLADWKALMSGKMWQSKYIPWWERGSVLPGVILQIGEAFIPIPGQTLQRSIIGDEPWIVGGSSVFGIHIKEYKGDQAKWKPKVSGGIRGAKGIGGVGGYGGF
jgi:predicted DNA-binding protein